MNHNDQHPFSITPPKAKHQLLAKAGMDLHILITGLTRAVMYKEVTPTQADNNLFNIGHWHVVGQMIKDLLHNLKHIDEHANHGLKGTIPEDYDPWGYGCNEEEKPYDPYDEMMDAFRSDTCIPVTILPEDLKELLDRLPETNRAQSEAFDHFFGDNLTQYDPETQESHKLTIEQRAAHIDNDYVQALELSFVAGTYESDMQQVKHLIETRAPFEAILKVLHNW